MVGTGQNFKSTGVRTSYAWGFFLPFSLLNHCNPLEIFLQKMSLNSEILVLQHGSRAKPQGLLL